MKGDKLQTNNDEFYIGYLRQAPPGISAIIKKTVAIFIGLGILIAAILVAGQNAFYPSFFEFGNERIFEGKIVEKPYPMLHIQRPGNIENESAGQSQFYLVAFGKFGAEEAVKGLDGQKVRLKGSLIYRDGETMIEIVGGSIEKFSDEINSPASVVYEKSTGISKGKATLVGEIVDSKCFLGVMNPGNLKTHKACAIRCISGGIPPVFIVKTTGGETNYFLLISQKNKTVNTEVLEMIAEPVEISGEIVKQGDVLYLKADPGTYKVL